MKLSIGKLRIDGGTQPRASKDLGAVADYAEAMRSGDVFPPVVAFYDGVNYWLADGFHRRDATIAAGLDEIEAEIKQGSVRDAILYSCSANSLHGLRRTNEDKRRAVIRLVEDQEWSHKTQGEIASICNVSREFVNRLTKELELSCDRSQDVSSPRIVERNGTTYQMDTSHIGNKPEAPAIDNMVHFAKPQEEKNDGNTRNLAYIETMKRAAYDAITEYFAELDEFQILQERKAMMDWLMEE